MRLGDNLFIQNEAQVALDATADVLEFRPSVPIRVIRWGFIVSVDCTGTLIAELDVETHIADGTPTRVESPGGTDLSRATAAAEGHVLFCVPTTDLVIKPGDAAFIQISDAFTAGDGFAFIQFQALNWDPNSARSEFEDATPTNRLIDASVAA